MGVKQREHGTAPGGPDNFLAQLRIEEEVMRDARHALK